MTSSVDVVRFVGSVEGMEEAGAEVTLDLTALTGGLATAPREGDVVILAFSYVHTGSYVDLGDLEPTTTGYTELDELKKSGSLYHNTSYVGYKFMTSTPDTTVVVPSNPQTGSATAVIAYVLRNVNSAVAVTSVSAVGDGSSIPNPPEITPTAVGTTVVVVGTTTRTFRSGLGDYLVAPPSGYDNFASIDGLVSDGVITFSTHVGIAMKAWETGAEDPSAFSVYSNSSSSSSAWGAMSIALVPVSIWSNTDKSTSPTWADTSKSTAPTWADTNKSSSPTWSNQTK